MCPNCHGSNVEETDEGSLIKTETENVSINPSNMIENLYWKCKDCRSVFQTSKNPVMCPNCYGTKVEETEEPSAIKKKSKHKDDKWKSGGKMDDDMMMFRKFGPP